MNTSTRTHDANCAVIIPVGPGHQRLVEQAESSVREAINHGKGPFNQITICKIDDAAGEKGPARARNIAIDRRLEQGCQWLFFLDADDLLCHDAFQIASEYIDDHDAIWGSVFELPPGRSTAVIKPEQLHRIQDFEQLLHYDDVSVALQTGHFVKTTVAARIRFNETLLACEEIDHFFKIWKAYRCIKARTPLCLTRRGRESQRLAQTRREEIAAFIVRKHRCGLDEFLDEIPAWSHTYRKENTNRGVLENLFSGRRRLCEHYLRLPEDVFRAELEFTRDAYFALMQSEIRKHPPPEAEHDFLTTLLEQDCSHPKSVQYLLTLFLYCFPHQLPERWRARLSLPKWTAEYLYAWFNMGRTKDAFPRRRWKVVDGEELEGVPPDFELPPIVGENNDYTFLEERRAAFVDSGAPYTLGVSIVIPVYNRKEKLARTLAAITHQTYPAELLEVIVADDGSSDGVEEVIDKYRRYLSLEYVRQEDRGFRAAAVRNLGAEAARYDYIALLDCDMLPEPECIEYLMQYLHVTNRAVVIGHRRFVCTDGVSDDQILENIDAALRLPDVTPSDEHARPEQGEPIIDPRMKRYPRDDYLKKGIFSSFSAFYSCSTAYPKKVIEEAGSFDEDFQAWGGEDTELGYRIYNAGYYFIPVLEAVSLHQEPPEGENETDREEGRTLTHPLLEQKCPVPPFRTYRANVIHDAPKVSIYIPAYNAGRHIEMAVDSALAQTYTDLEVCIVDDGSTDNTLQVLEQKYTHDSRVHWISRTHSGIARTSNIAVNMCRGLYISRLNAGDILLRLDAVEIMVKHLDARNVGCVYGNHALIDENGLSIGQGRDCSGFSREKLMSGLMAPQFWMYRKRDWMRTSGFDETLERAVDYDMLLKLSEVCSFYHIDEFLYGHGRHGETISGVHEEMKDQGYKLCVEKALQRTGLYETWKVHAPDPRRPGKFLFQRRILP